MLFRSTKAAPAASASRSARTTRTVGQASFAKEEFVSKAVAVTRSVHRICHVLSIGAKVRRTRELVISWMISSHLSFSFFFADPCKSGATCGRCALCQVVDHSALCQCPVNTVGNPLELCSVAPQRCSGSGCAKGFRCEGGYCLKACRATTDCDCGQTCSNGKCLSQCSSRMQCPQGQICDRDICVSGCRANSDCDFDQACVQGQCQNPCLTRNICGKNALCQITQHRALCLCPDGMQGDPTAECRKLGCQRSEDCNVEQECLNG